MSVVFACIAPHSGHLLVSPQRDSPVPSTRAAMEVLREALRAAKPDAVAVLTPHGVYVPGLVTVASGRVGVGAVDDLIVRADLDPALSEAWCIEAAGSGIPAVLAATGDKEPFPLDWGTTIPLSLLDPEAQLPLAVACPCRGLSRTQLIDLGAALAIAAGDLGRRVALIVSADQGHGHAADGPYGYTPASIEFDRAMTAAVQDDTLEDLVTWDEEWITSGLPDSYWQTLALIGVRRIVDLRARFLSYEVDHYFGLLCAAYEEPNQATR
ncbi:MAG: hypothetical protein ACLQVD_18240 [Capsulimonadaceae bacterium]